jgi:hypothetical protein
MDKRKGYVLLLINASVRNSVSESINLNKVVANLEKHILLSQADLTRTGIISNSYNEMFKA